LKDNGFVVSIAERQAGGGNLKGRCGLIEKPVPPVSTEQEGIVDDCIHN
jgi:hypothetical protein